MVLCQALWGAEYKSHRPRNRCYCSLLLGTEKGCSLHDSFAALEGENNSEPQREGSGKTLTFLLASAAGVFIAWHTRPELPQLCIWQIRDMAFHRTPKPSTVNSAAHRPQLTAPFH